MTDISKAILDCPMQSDEVDAPTVRDYLKILLISLWQQKEGFDGKRPFGNSGWDFDVYVALIKGGVIDGKLDEYDYVLALDTKAADKLIREAISTLS